jgi:hypothetical protein
VSEGLEREVGDHLVRVHVGRRPGTPLDHVDDELVMPPPLAELRAYGPDGVRASGIQHAQLLVRRRRSRLDAGEGIDEL